MTVWPQTIEKEPKNDYVCNGDFTYKMYMYLICITLIKKTLFNAERNVKQVTVRRLIVKKRYAKKACNDDGVGGGTLFSRKQSPFVWSEAKM